MRRLLQRGPVRAARGREQRVVWRRRRGVRRMRARSGVQQRRTVRVQLDLVPERLLQRQHVRALRLRGERLVRHRWPGVRGLFVGAGM